jgi:carboxymethylenebutenolidase
MPGQMAAGSGERGMPVTASDRHGGLAGVLDDHLAAEFATRDVDATMATMADDPYLNHVPVLTGDRPGGGTPVLRADLHRPLVGGHRDGEDFPDRRHRPGGRRAGDVLHPRHHHEPHAPRRAAHGQAITAGGVRGGRLPRRKLTHEHIYWDQASLLVQVGLLDPAGLPVVGAEQAEKLLAPRTIPASALLGPDWPSPC